MPNEIFVADEGTLIIVDCGCDITDASVTQIKGKYPDGTEFTWTASISGTDYLNYNLVATDTENEGLIKAQAYIETPSGKWSGEKFMLKINSNV